MHPEPDIAPIAALLGDPTRAAICMALLGGIALPAGELAIRARVSAQTASNHLDKLLRNNILAVEQQGRWRYYRLNGEPVAATLEALAVIAPPLPAVTHITGPTGQLREARTCYTHLAGKLGVALTDALQRHAWIERRHQDFHITDRGAARFAELGIILDTLRHGRRPLCYACLDWSERRHHMAGPLAKAILATALSRHWVRRLPGTRAVRITPAGRKAFHTQLHVQFDNASPLPA